LFLIFLYNIQLFINILLSHFRQNYCINKNVKRLKHVNLINETCLQLQRKKSTVKKEKDLKRLKTTGGCPFIPGDQRMLMAEVLTNIQDVEEITQKGQESNTCPYYGSRKSLQNGQLILVPYNSILHKNTRVSLGIDLKGNVLIIDEAHNLLDAIERMHSSVITGRNLLHCYSQLSQYQKRYCCSDVLFAVIVKLLDKFLAESNMIADLNLCSLLKA